MSKESSKKLFEWYAQVALDKLKEIKKEAETFKDCKTREQFSNYMLNVFVAHYGLRCTCDDCMDWDFNQAGGHYHHCELYKFTHLVNRCLDWAEERRGLNLASNEGILYAISNEVKMEEWYWIFRDKKTGRIDISRHSRPDFVAQYKTEGHIKIDYDRMLIRFPKSRFDIESTVDNNNKKPCPVCNDQNRYRKGQPDCSMCWGQGFVKS